MYDKFYIGMNLTGFEKNGVHRPVSRVTLKIGGNQSVTAGDDTGLEITANCPYATQEMADSILASVKGMEYRMYSAQNTNLDPSAELGDGMTACGLYSVIANISDDGYGYPDIAAPGEAELEYQYPYESYTKRRLDNLDSKVEEISSELEEISGKLEGIIAGASGVISFNGRDGVVVPEREDYLEFIEEEIQKAIYESWKAAY